MRQVVLDTETTGLEVNKGHRIVEIGCVELLERRPTGREFHRYVNPQRKMDEGATAVSGITDDSLVDKPLFADVADEFLAFIDGAELIAHNASFDMGFLNAEFGRLEQPVRIVERVSVLDTLLLAREKFPGQKNNLDALCKRLGVDNSHRDLHGALLDAQLLADVYLAMTAGQGDLGLGLQSEPAKERVRAAVSTIVNAAIRVRRADPAELAAHEARLAAIQKTSKENCRWLRE
ncbi:MAG: DNA polymerase III subunit epsilon [Rudaea sp.]|uniref:DNA polymerase III subunit epsilon n=1 Tax=unclassified Rudaea TaxID=2627037 RepID=UPI0010F73460|nr:MULTISPECIES: DNA polymerase III subunit epsilon [unclassified Rudaea]MBN8884657.1 DNA polymerase III subunit epsilon [Rudaea sp.]